MNQNVCFQLIAVRESRAAEIAGIRPLARVHSQMSTKIRNLHELPLTVRTVVRFFARVQAHVSLEVVVPSKALVALFTLEGFFPSVCPFVVLQDVFIAEAAMADVAGEFFLFLLAVVVAAAFYRYPGLRRVDSK